MDKRKKPLSIMKDFRESVNLKVAANGDDGPDYQKNRTEKTKALGKPYRA